MNINKIHWWGGTPDPQTKITITGTQTAMRAEGDSFTAGGNASVAANRYANIVSTTKSLTLTNLGVSGQGIWARISSIQGTEYALSSLCTLMIGLNDLRAAVTISTKTINKIKEGFRCYLHRLMVTNAEVIRGASGAATVTRVGTITAYNAAAGGGIWNTGAIPGTVATVSSTAGDNWSYTQTCTGFVVQFIASDGVVETLGSGTIQIDGTTVKTFDLNNWTNGVSDGTNANTYCPLSFCFTGLTNASHTLKVTVTSGKVPVDYIAAVRAFSAVPPCLVAEIPYTNEGTYTDSASASASAGIKALVTEYRALGMNVAYVKTNTYYVRSTGTSGDNLHPNDTGHAQIANAFLAAIN